MSEFVDERLRVRARVSWLWSSNADKYAAAMSRCRNGAVARMTIQTASPMTGTVSSTAGNFRLAITLAMMAMTRIAATITT